MTILLDNITMTIFPSISGNSVALLTISSTRTLHSPPIVLIGFLAIVDCLIGLLHLLPVSIAWFSDGWPGGPSGNLSVRSLEYFAVKCAIYCMWYIVLSTIYYILCVCSILYTIMYSVYYIVCTI